MDNIFDLDRAVFAAASALWVPTIAVDLRRIGCSVVGFTYGRECLDTRSIGIYQLEVPNNSD